MTFFFLSLLLQIQLVSEHAFEIPDNVRPGHLIKELSKVIRAIEVRIEVRCLLAVALRSKWICHHAVNIESTYTCEGIEWAELALQLLGF